MDLRWRGECKEGGEGKRYSKSREEEKRGNRRATPINHTFPFYMRQSRWS